MIAIFAAIKKALSAALGFGWGVFDFMLSLPFLLLGAARGPGAAPHITLPTIKERNSTGI